MRREAQRYIVEINGFDGTEVSVSVRTADGRITVSTLCHRTGRRRKERQLLTRVIAQWQKPKRHGQKRRNPEATT